MNQPAQIPVASQAQLSSARQPSPDTPEDGWGYLNALTDSIIVVRHDLSVDYVNLAAEQFLQAGRSVIQRDGLLRFFTDDSALHSLIGQVIATGSPVAEHDITLESPRMSPQSVTVHASPVGESLDRVIIVIRDHSIARTIERQLNHRGAARSVSAMASMLAHEIKNPLSGIRGAAQLIEPSLTTSERELTRLICDETDRICALVDQMEIFSDQRPLEKTAINIHEVLEHVRSVAIHGFAKNVQFEESYDPSLPPVYGNRDQLIQVFINLMKNASEAVPEKGGEIRLLTAFRPGVKLSSSANRGRVHLPLAITVQDNGPGIPSDLHQHLFDPFVTTKASGKGLGLALVAKIIDDHGGAIELLSEEGKTSFNVMLPTVDTVGAER